MPKIEFDSNVMNKEKVERLLLDLELAIIKHNMTSEDLRACIRYVGIIKDHGLRPRDMLQEALRRRSLPVDPRHKGE